jgi:hypothetical protein
MDFAHFGMIIRDGAQLLSCSHSMNNTSILLISKVNLVGQSSSLEDEIYHFLMHPWGNHTPLRFIIACDKSLLPYIICYE